MKNKNISNGKNAINIGKIEHFEVYSTQNRIKNINYKKKNLKSINVNPRTIRSVGILGTGASLITLLSLFFQFPIIEQPTLTQYIFFLPIFFLLISLLGIVLVKRQFIPFMGKYSLESSDQKIHIKRTLIKCPECNSKMRIFQSNTGVYVSCERNPEQHIFPFDYTTFKDNE